MDFNETTSSCQAEQKNYTLASILLREITIDASLRFCYLLVELYSCSYIICSWCHCRAMICECVDSWSHLLHLANGINLLDIEISATVRSKAVVYIVPIVLRDFVFGPCFVVQY